MYRLYMAMNSVNNGDKSVKYDKTGLFSKLFKLKLHIKGKNDSSIIYEI